MRKIVDIRPLKRELRAKYRKIRENMDPAQKKEFDEAILSVWWHRLSIGMRGRFYAMFPHLLR